MPMVILGNKGDMVHLRQVSSEEGKNHKIQPIYWVIENLPMVSLI